MKELDRLFLEALEGLSTSRMSPTYSEEPRKDFGPQSGSKGYHYPYQSNLDSASKLGLDDTPQNTPLVPWELSKVDVDLADSVVYLSSALDKINYALNTNTTLSKNQIFHLKKYREVLTICLNKMQAIGNRIITLINLAGSLQPMMPKNIEEK